MSAAVCGCGVQAVGRCPNCGSAFCWSHQGRAIDYTPLADLCRDCGLRQREASRTWTRAEDVLEELSDDPNPWSRLTRGLRRLPKRSARVHSDQDLEALWKLVPELHNRPARTIDRKVELALRPHRPFGVVLWDSDAAAGWFTTNAAQALTPDSTGSWLVVRRGPFGLSTKLRTEPAWRWASIAASDGGRGYRSVLVFPDGRWAAEGMDNHDRKYLQRSHEVWSLGSEVLKSFADILGLPQ